jgi:hypothetical protein
MAERQRRQPATVLLDAATDSRLYLPIVLAVTTGMRKGEMYPPSVGSDSGVGGVLRKSADTIYGPQISSGAQYLVYREYAR